MIMMMVKMTMMAQIEGMMTSMAEGLGSDLDQMMVALEEAVANNQVIMMIMNHDDHQHHQLMIIFFCFRLRSLKWR